LPNRKKVRLETPSSAKLEMSDKSLKIAKSMLRVVVKRQRLEEVELSARQRDGVARRNKNVLTRTQKFAKLPDAVFANKVIRGSISLM
jgi:hypothetical protein